MSPQQLKHGESSMEASSGQMATELKYQRRDIIAAHILVQMANDDSALLHHRSSLYGVKRGMKGKPKMRWEMRGDRIGVGDSYSEVARRKAKCFKKCQQAAFGGQMNDADRFGALRERSVDVAGSVKIPRHVKYTISEEDDNMYKAWHGHDLTESWGNNDQKPAEAGLEGRHDRLGKFSIKKRKRVAQSYFRSDAEDVVVPVKIPIKISGYKRMIATINPSSEERIAYFRKEEALRYLVPGKGFCYTALDGRKSAVAPLIRKVSTAHQDHVILKADRPPVVSIVCLVRDAAARLPGGRGNRADICTLMRDSQYLIEYVSDEQLHYLASKGLDRATL